MKTPEDLYADVMQAVRRVQVARQDHLEAGARVAATEAALTAAEAELAAARAEADGAIEIAIGRRPMPDPPRVDPEAPAAEVTESLTAP